MFRSYQITRMERLENRRLLSAGGLDPSFGGTGRVDASFAPLGGVHMNAMAVQPDGKIVEVGQASDGDLAMVRFNPDGTLDTTFGPTHTGKIVTSYGSSNNISAGALAIQGDGKIVVGASRGSVTFDVLRLNSDGSFDKTFNGGGFVNIDVGFGTNASGSPTGIAVQTDGKIVVAGGVTPFISGDNFFVARLNPNGSLDPSFGDPILTLPGHPVERTGTTSVDFGDFDDPSALAIDYDGTPANNSDYGRIVVVGEHSTSGASRNQIALARLNPNGTLDSSFNGNGKRALGLAGAINLQAHGVVFEGTGGGFAISGGFFPTAGASRFLLMEFNPNGSTDTSFGSNGVVTTAFTQGNADAFSIVNGFARRIIVGGQAGSNILLAAYSTNGQLDSGFGAGGKVITAGDGANGAYALALGANRTIIAAGGDNCLTQRFFDIGPSVSVAALNSTASEKGPVSATFIVTRDVTLPFDTRVYFTIGGTATPPTEFLEVKNHQDDYTLSGMTIQLLGVFGHPPPPPYVDIPADQTFTFVTLTPTDNIAFAGTRTASFTINSDPLYDIGASPNAAISIVGDKQTSKTFAASADAYVQDGADANQNFGAAKQLLVKKSGTGFNRQSYIKFDLSSFTGSISSVQLQITGNLSISGQTNLVTQVFSVANTSWTDTGITFNNKPAAGATALASATIQDTTKRAYLLDVTAYVKAQLAAGHKIISFVLKNPSNSDAVMFFDSREAGSTGPQLVVDG